MPRSCELITVHLPVPSFRGIDIFSTSGCPSGVIDHRISRVISIK